MSKISLAQYGADTAGTVVAVLAPNRASRKPDDDFLTGPAQPCPAWHRMAPVWRKVDAVLGGTATMRAAGEEYLPRHTEESPEAYTERLSKSVFTNITRQTVNTWTGKPFSEPIRVEDSVPAQLKQYLPDIDLCGNELQVLAREWFMKGLAYGLCHVLVEYPVVMQPQDGTVRTKADDLAEGIRPYAVLIEPSNLVDARREVVNGRERITMIAVVETATIQDPDNPYGQVEVKRLKRYIAGPAGSRDGTVQHFEWRQIEKDKWDWVLIDEWGFGFDGIPLVTFYANRTAFMEARPPIEDLVDLNIAHWQSESDQVNILTVTRFPQLVAKGVPFDAKITVGPNNIIRLTDPSSDIHYVEHAGSAIQAGEQHIKSLEERMYTYGTQFLRRQPGRVTATARTLDTAEATSELQDTAIRFNDALNQMLQLFAEWEGLPDGGKATIQKEFGITEGSAESLQVLHLSATTGLISREQYVAELSQRGVLSDLFDPVANEKQLKAQHEEEISREAALTKPKPVAEPPTT